MINTNKLSTVISNISCAVWWPLILINIRLHLTYSKIDIRSSKHLSQLFTDIHRWEKRMKKCSHIFLLFLVYYISALLFTYVPAPMSFTRVKVRRILPLWWIFVLILDIVGLYVFSLSRTSALLHVPTALQIRFTLCGMQRECVSTF